MSWRRRIVVAFLLLLAAVAVVWTCLPRPVPVETARLSRAPLRVTVDGEGKTRLRDRFVVSAPAAGYARRLALDVGDAVGKGQPVATLLPLRPEALDARARAVAEARAEAAEAALRAAVQNVSEAAAAHRYAAARLERMRKLQEAQLTPRDALEQAEAEAEAKRAEKDSAEDAVDAARHELEAARAALTRTGDPAVKDGEKLVVRSPIAGRVLAVRHESEGAVPAGTPLLEVGDPGRLEVEVDLLSADAVRVHTGTPVRFERWGGEAPLEGKVRLVEPVAFTKVSALGVEEQRVLVIVDLTSPRERWSRLGDGYRMEASFVLWEEKDVLQLPAAALFRSGDRFAAYAVEKGRARLRPVEVGKRNGLAAQVLSGLAEGETVVLHPGDAVTDGGKVRAR